MKKLVLLLGLAVCFAPDLKAQASASTPNVVTAIPLSRYKLKLDTVGTSATKTLTLPVSGIYEHFTLQTTLTKISGTAGGVVRLYVSNDGVNFAQIKTDSLIVANVATQTKVFDIGAPKYLVYQLGYTSAGTQSVTFKALAVLRKRTTKTE